MKHNPSVDFCVRCYDCDRIYYPLSQSQAVETATQHCENTQHMDVHALPFSEVLPLIGEFKRGDKS